MWYTEAFALEKFNPDPESKVPEQAAHELTVDVQQPHGRTLKSSADLPQKWFRVASKLEFRQNKVQAILAFINELSEQETATARDKIIDEFGQATYDYVIQFPIIHESMPTLTLPRVIYDYKAKHISQIYCRSQIRQIETHCQLRDLAVIVRDELLCTGKAYDPATVEPPSWASIASVI